MIAVVDTAVILARSKCGALAREVIEVGSREDEADLLTLIREDIRIIVACAGEATRVKVILEREGVLYVSPESVDITKGILAAYDAEYDRLLATRDRATLMQQLKAHLLAIRKAREDRERYTGQYL